MEHLVQFKVHLKDIVPLKVAEREYYKSFSNYLQKYEDFKLKRTNAVGELAHVTLISGPGNDHLKQKLETLS